VPWPVNQIGPFYFLSLSGQIEGLKAELEVLARPGVAGVGLWNTGRRGRPYTVRSEVDAQDEGQARDMYGAYTQLIGADPVPIVWLNLALGYEGYLVAVLDVRLLDIRRLGGATPGLNPPSAGFIACEWDLIAIPV